MNMIIGVVMQVVHYLDIILITPLCLDIEDAHRQLWLPYLL